MVVVVMVGVFDIRDRYIWERLNTCSLSLATSASVVHYLIILRFFCQGGSEKVARRSSKRLKIRKCIFSLVNLLQLAIVACFLGVVHGRHAIILLSRNHYFTKADLATRRGNWVEDAIGSNPGGGQSFSRDMTPSFEFRAMLLNLTDCLCHALIGAVTLSSYRHAIVSLLPLACYQFSAAFDSTKSMAFVFTFSTLSSSPCFLSNSKYRLKMNFIFLEDRFVWIILSNICLE